MKTKLHSISSSKSNKICCSLPMPPSFNTIEIAGATSLQAIPLGEWPARTLANSNQMSHWPDAYRTEPAGFNNPPRRCLVYAEFAEDVDDNLDVSFKPAKGLINQCKEDTFKHSLSSYGEHETYHHRDEEIYHYVKREDIAMVELGNRKLKLRLAIKINDEIRYWQWTEVIPAWNGKLTAAYTIGGHIYAGEKDAPLTTAEAQDLENSPAYQECTIAAKAFIILHADGLIELTTHFANVQGYGRGENALGLPLIEFTSEEQDLSSKLTVCEGLINQQNNSQTIHWQPLESTEIYLGDRLCRGLIQTGNTPQAQYVDDSEKGLIKGVGRSFSCTLKLSSNSTPVTRCLAAPEWYATCGEFGVPFQLRETQKPFTKLFEISDLAKDVFLRNVHPSGMSRGGIYRYLDKDANGRIELSLDGNESMYIFRGAYMRSSQELYQLAMESARCIADIALDHYYFNIHYHGDTSEWSLFSLIYLRFGGLVQAWQETGDPWYLESAEAVANRWISVNRQNQPRKNMGRDCEPVDGILSLYDATGKDHYFQEAEKIALDVANSLFDDYFWRSGYGVGPYWGINALNGQAWNGSHLLAGLSPFLERADSSTSPHYDYLIKKACGMIKRLIQSIDEDYGGFHRTSGSFIPHRYYIIAHLANNKELENEIMRIITGMTNQFELDDNDYFKAGHHCAAYLESPYVINALLY